MKLQTITKEEQLRVLHNYYCRQLQEAEQMVESNMTKYTVMFYAETKRKYEEVASEMQRLGITPPL